MSHPMLYKGDTYLIEQLVSSAAQVVLCASAALQKGLDQSNPTDPALTTPRMLLARSVGAFLHAKEQLHLASVITDHEVLEGELAAAIQFIDPKDHFSKELPCIE